MWSSSRVVRGLVLGLALGGAALAVAGCSFTPVYGERGVARGRLALAYAEPQTRLDQIVIQELSLRLGSAGGPDAPVVRITTSVANRALTRTGTTKPFRQFEVTVTVAYTVTAGGKVVAVGNRAAAAAWSTRGQVLADEEARKDAEERAARAAAETVRLALIGALASPVQ